MKQRLRGEGGPSRYPKFKRHEVELISSKPRFLNVRRSRREEGQALVEFALVLPVLLIILLAIMQFGILFENYLTMTDAVRAGTRVLAVGRGSSDPCTAAVQATKNAATGLTLNTTSSASTSQIVTSVQNDSPSGITCPTQGDLVEGASVTITAYYPCNINILGMSFGGLSGPRCLSASATERIE